MGALMFLGMVFSGLYSGYVIKNDIQATKRDFVTKATDNKENNKRKINNMFETICKRSGIQLSENKNPIKKKQLKKGVEYLKLQGYEKESVDYFIDLFNEKIENEKQYSIHTVSNELNKLYYQLKHSSEPKIKYVWKRNYYGNDIIEKRMNKIIDSDRFWQMITKREDCTYITGTNGARYTEIWHLYAPKNFFKENDLNDIYKKTCWLYGIDNGSFR